MIEDRTVTVAICDACGKIDYSDDQGGFFGGNGYTLSLTEHGDWSQHKVYACRETHIGKAARVVLFRAAAHRADGDQDDDQDDDGELPADAPPLPQHDDMPEEP
jgi:hypothetical protein